MKLLPDLGSLCLCVTFANSVYAASLPVQGVGGTRQLRGDHERVYYDLSVRQELTLAVQGPKVVVLELVPHQAAGGEATAVAVELTHNGEHLGELSLACQPTTLRFAKDDGSSPCAPLQRRLDVGAGAHTIGMRLLGGTGASVLPRLEAIDSGFDVDGIALEPIVLPTHDQKPHQGSTVEVSPSFWVRVAKRPKVWAPAAAAVLALGVGAIFGVSSQHKFDAAAGDVTQLRRQRLNELGSTHAWTANILFAAAAVGAGVAAGFGLVDWMGAPAASANVGGGR